MRLRFAAWWTAGLLALLAGTTALAVPPLHIAHRGASALAPENTLTALRLAASQGADYAEIDVQRSRDQQLVLMHDASLARTTDAAQRYPQRKPWYVMDFDFAQIRSLDAGLWRGPLFRGEPVPALSEALNLCRDRLGLLIELKNPKLYPGIERQLLAVLTAAGWLRDGVPQQKLMVHSLDWEILRRLHRDAPQLPLVLLAVQAPSAAQLRDYGFARAVGVDQRTLSALTVSWLHAAGKQVFAYDVDDPQRQRELIAMGVDALIVNSLALAPSP